MTLHFWQLAPNRNQFKFALVRINLHSGFFSSHFFFLLLHVIQPVDVLSILHLGACMGCFLGRPLFFWAFPTLVHRAVPSALISFFSSIFPVFEFYMMFVDVT